VRRTARETESLSRKNTKKKKKKQWGIPACNLTQAKKNRGIRYGQGGPSAKSVGVRDVESGSYGAESGLCWKNVLWCKKIGSLPAQKNQKSAEHG